MTWQSSPKNNFSLIQPTRMRKIWHDMASHCHYHWHHKLHTYNNICRYVWWPSWAFIFLKTFLSLKHVPVKSQVFTRISPMPLVSTRHLLLTPPPIHLFMPFFCMFTGYCCRKITSWWFLNNMSCSWQASGGWGDGITFLYSMFSTWSLQLFRFYVDKRHFSKFS